MKRSIELRKQIEDVKNKIRFLNSDNKIEEAHNALEDLRNLRKQLEIAEEIEDDEEALAQATNKVHTNIKDVNVNRIFNKLVLGKELNEQEKEFQNSTGAIGQVESVNERGGYLVPQEQLNRILEYKRSLNPLKPLCNGIPVGTNSGSMPLEVEEDEELVNFDELDEMEQKDLKFAQTKWEINNYGVIVPISNILLADTDIDLVGYVMRKFGKRAVNTENRKIVDVIKTANKAKTVATDYKALKTVLNVELNTAISTGAKIVCSQSAFDYLDLLEDKNGRPLLNPILGDETRMQFKGREIIPVLDKYLGTKTMDFYVGAIDEFVAFFDRQQVTMSMSTEAGFTKNATLIKIMERFDVGKGDSEAVKKVSINVGVGA